VNQTRYPLNGEPNAELKEHQMKLIKYASAALMSVCFMFCSDFASAQQLACSTPVGLTPIFLPPGVPVLQGVPCNGVLGSGTSVIVGNVIGPQGFPVPIAMPQPIPAPFIPQQALPAPIPQSSPGPMIPGQLVRQLPGVAPVTPSMFGDHTALSPQAMATGQAARVVGLNHEGQVSAQCVAQFGVTYAGGGCIAARLTADELNKCLTVGVGGNGCFGNNNALVSMVRANVEASKRESGDLNKGIRVITGISPRDIQEHGIWGGNNSVFRCPFGGC
jgi:hypothetical protein